MSIYGRHSDNLNQSVEAPSPAPAPAAEPTTPPTPQPRSEIVIEAKAVKNNVISCKKIDEKDSDYLRR